MGGITVLRTRARSWRTRAEENAFYVSTLHAVSDAIRESTEDSQEAEFSERASLSRAPGNSVTQIAQTTTCIMRTPASGRPYSATLPIIRPVETTRSKPKSLLDAMSGWGSDRTQFL